MSIYLFDFVRPLRVFTSELSIIELIPNRLLSFRFFISVFGCSITIQSKLRGQVAAEQERLLSSKETELQDAHAELERIKCDLKAARDSASSLSAQLKTKSDELAEAQRTIKTNENSERSFYPNLTMS